MRRKVMCECCGRHEAARIMEANVGPADYLRLEPESNGAVDGKRVPPGPPLCLGCAASNPRMVCLFCRLAIRRAFGWEGYSFDHLEGCSYDVTDGRDAVALADKLF